MKIIIKEPGQRPRATEIENSLSACRDNPFCRGSGGQICRSQ